MTTSFVLVCALFGVVVVFMALMLIALVLGPEEPDEDDHYYDRID